MKRLALFLFVLAIAAVIREIRRPYDEARLFGQGAPPAGPRRREAAADDGYGGGYAVADAA
jgi:hypothetical protein